VREGINDPAVQEPPRPCDERGSKYAATAAEIRSLLERAGFVPRTLEIRTFTTVFRDVAQIIKYPDRVSSDGIRLERYVLLAVADKPR
jgi:hypothetical protein